ncbi:WcaI family glycosyltransferase [Methylocella sp.]|uniref:WcaI family glycosyltransferase n=1 Tax=Methylocella sp. TaxID=1978226 RepID=UPI0037851172
MRSSSKTGDKRLKILIVGENYAPEMTGVGRYTGEIGAYLAECGYDVSVVAAPPHYPGWRVRAPYSAWRYARERLDGVKVTRCPIVLREEMRGIWRLIAPASFAAASLPPALWAAVVERPDVVLCIEPTLMVAPAGLFARLFGARLLLHVQDLEFDAAFAVGHLRGGALKRALFGFESWLLKRFDGIVTISGQMSKRLVEKGVDPARLRIVRNWVDLDKIRPMQGQNAFRAELGLGADDFVALYAGNIGVKQALEVALDAARRLAGRTNVHFVVAGDGPEKARLMRDYGDLANVRFLPLQPEERLCELLNLADLHILPQSRGAADLVLPSKLGGMLASGKPVLATADAGTELHEVLSGVGVLVPAGDSEAMAVEIARLAAEGRHPALGDGRALASMFARETCLAQFRAFVDGAAASV